MNKTFLERYVQQPQTPVPLDSEEIIDALGNFGVLRGARDRSPSIEFRRKSGNILVIPYSWIETMMFDPSEGITIKTGGRNIRIKGRNLTAEIRPNIRPMSALALHKVAWIQEQGASELLSEKTGGPIVVGIEW